jgi:hypothetical protein
MRFWMDVMRALEPVLCDYERLFDAWEAGGCTGLVIGPLAFDGARLGKNISPIPSSSEPYATYDPDPSVYERFGVDTPPAPPTPPSSSERRAKLKSALYDAKRRGWTVLIFQPQSGMSSGGPGHHITDETTHRAIAARAVDTLRQYPMVDGAVFDGPEWGYEIDPNHRSYLFDDLPESLRSDCARLGYDYSVFQTARDRLFERLHNIDGPIDLLSRVDGVDGDDALAAWLSFRQESLTDYFSSVSELVRAGVGRSVILSCGPRTAAFAGLAGYDLPALADVLDVLLPKFYVWHRGFDGLIGTVGRYVQTLTAWNPGLNDADALGCIEKTFGLRLPGVRNRTDLEEAMTPAFFDEVVTAEANQAVSVVPEPERIVSWIDAGRFPHDGDPMSARDLALLLRAAAKGGIEQFVYHHSGNLTSGEWTVISDTCGVRWDSATSHYEPPDTLEL